jgi:hypothetical protein
LVIRFYQLTRLTDGYAMLCYGSYISEVKDDLENAGESMKKGAKKTGNRMEEGAEEAGAKPVVTSSIFLSKNKGL